MKIVFLDDETVLALIAHGADSLELRAERVAPDPLGNVTVVWRERLDPIEDPQLFIDRERHSWTVVGRADGDWTFEVASDTAAGVTPRVRHFGQRSSNEIGKPLTNPLAAFGDGGVLWATFPRVGHNVASFTPILLALAASPRWELRGTDSSRERVLLDMEGFPSCAIEVDRRGTLCIGRGPNGSSVWRATPNLALSLIAQLPPTFDVVHAESSTYIIAAERFGANIVVVDAMTHAGARLTLPVAETKQPWSRWTADVAARDRYAIVLSGGRGGATVSRFAFR